MADLLHGKVAAIAGLPPGVAGAIRGAFEREGATMAGDGERADVLVAGGSGDIAPGRFEDTDLASWRAAVDATVFGTLDAVRPVAERMRAGGAGSIVFVCSAAVRVPQPGRGAEAVADRGLLAAAQVLARELGPAGVRVNTVVAGSSAADDEIADAVLFFASDLAEVVTGQSLAVDRGETFH